jgi:hypothetical protein
MSHPAQPHSPHLSKTVNIYFNYLYYGQRLLTKYTLLDKIWKIQMNQIILCVKLILNDFIILSTVGTVVVMTSLNEPLFPILYIFKSYVSFSKTNIRSHGKNEHKNLLLRNRIS